ncbi:3632_t:CDS:10 [Paraglomus brasilianum]|uniref:3632_t:CDS:1 n=1 Tax=Paraglomus brasilianum TaxID=144538 RepID=A0A9N9GNL9_9GLOM|nr:3632_t:CDS:10 [Paraglomus brasilianum]
MTKHKHFTRLVDESESSLSSPSIPLQSLTSSSQIHVSTAQSSDLPHVVNVRGGPVPGMDIETEWPLNELPEELREPDDDNDRAANNTEANSMRTNWKKELFLLLEDPSSSRPAFSVNVFVSFSIVLSAVLTTIETIPSFRATESSVWFSFETTIVLIFSIEYLLRLIAHSDSAKQLLKFVTAPLAVIDFIAIMPYYIELIFHHDTTYDFRFTILRLFRLLRVFRAFKYSSTIIMTIEVMIVAVKRSMDALSALFFFMVTSIVLFSTLLYFAERGTWDTEKHAFVDSNGKPSAFDSIPSAFWFVMVTITTTGYGDMVPTTFIGKLIAFPAMMCGILLIALPSIIVGRNFTLVWEAMRQYRRNTPNVREQANNVTLIEDAGTGYTMRANTRTSFESNHSYASQPARPGYETANDDILASQDALLEQMRTLITLAQQNQTELNRIQTVLEQSGIRLRTSGEGSVSTEKGFTSGS